MESGSGCYLDRNRLSRFCRGGYDIDGAAFRACDQDTVSTFRHRFIRRSSLFRQIQRIVTAEDFQDLVGNVPVSFLSRMNGLGIFHIEICEVIAEDEVHSRTRKAIQLDIRDVRKTIIEVPVGRHALQIGILEINKAVHELAHLDKANVGQLQIGKRVICANDHQSAVLVEIVDLIDDLLVIAEHIRRCGDERGRINGQRLRQDTELLCPFHCLQQDRRQVTAVIEDFLGTTEQCINGDSLRFLIQHLLQLIRSNIQNRMRHVIGTDLQCYELGVGHIIIKHVAQVFQLSLRHAGVAALIEDLAVSFIIRIFCHLGIVCRIHETEDLLSADAAACQVVVIGIDLVVALDSQRFPNQCRIGCRHNLMHAKRTFPIHIGIADGVVDDLRIPLCIIPE